MIYTVTVSPALDYVVKAENLSDDDISRAISAEFHFGGKGINVSAVLAQLGVPSIALGFAAGFTGEKLCSMLGQSGIANDFVKLDSGETRVNVKIRCGRELDINAPGPEIPSAKLSELYDKLKSIKSGDWLVLAGSIPAEMSEDIYGEMLKITAPKNIFTAVDTSGSALLKVLSYRPFLIKPNVFELGELFGRIPGSTEEIVKYAGILQEKGARNVLVSRGKDGAVLLSENGDIYPVSAVSGKLISSIGCGDSMVAGFIAGYINTSNYEKALKLSVAASAATAFSETLAARDEINSIINKMQ